MLTSAVFLRAASFGIPTAQPLKRGIGRSVTAIARCGLLFQNRKGSTITFADGIRQEKSHTPRVTPSYNVFARPFHVSAVGCIHDIQRFRGEYEPICEICYVNPTAYELPTDVERNPCTPYTSGYYCQECAEKEWEEQRRYKEAKAKIAATHQERRNKILDHVNSLPPGEKVPIAYAVDKVSTLRIWGDASAAWRSVFLRKTLSKELRIVKAGNGWMCDKERVDAMDFGLLIRLLVIRNGFNLARCGKIIPRCMHAGILAECGLLTKMYGIRF